MSSFSKTTGTALKLLRGGTTEIRIPRHAGFGVEQSMAFIELAGQAKRDVNGGLIRIQNSLFRKYTTEISVSRTGAPTFGNLNPQDLLTIHCVAEITQRVSSGAATLIRDPVPDSVRCFKANDKEIAGFSVSERSVTGATGATYLTFRPILECAVSAFSWNQNEITGEVSWSLSAEEV